MRDISAQEWDALLGQQTEPTPFMRHAYLLAMEESGSASPETGWKLQILSLRDPTQPSQPSQISQALSQSGRLAGAMVLYIKPHSYGEYVFDWAWADAYQRHGLNYYPKAVAAVPFTPVPGTRLHHLRQQRLPQHPGHHVLCLAALLQPAEVRARQQPRQCGCVVPQRGPALRQQALQQLQHLAHRQAGRRLRCTSEL